MSAAAAAETAFLGPTDVDDTALAELLVKVQFAFVRDRGIYVL